MCLSAHSDQNCLFTDHFLPMNTVTAIPMTVLVIQAVWRKFLYGYRSASEPLVWGRVVPRCMQRRAGEHQAMCPSCLPLAVPGCSSGEKRMRCNDPPGLANVASQPCIERQHAAHHKWPPPSLVQGYQRKLSSHG